MQSNPVILLQTLIFCINVDSLQKALLSLALSDKNADKWNSAEVVCQACEY